MPAQVTNEYDLECLLARDSLPILPVSELWQLAQIALKMAIALTPSRATLKQRDSFRLKSKQDMQKGTTSHVDLGICRVIVRLGKAREQHLKLNEYQCNAGPVIQGRFCAMRTFEYFGREPPRFVRN